MLLGSTRAENVRHGALSIPGVLSADFIFGPYDVICPIQATDMTDLEHIVVNLQTNVPGIKHLPPMYDRLHVDGITLDEFITQWRALASYPFSPF